MGFLRNIIDPFLYKINTDNGQMILAVYVDNLIIASSSDDIYKMVPHAPLRCALLEILARL